MLSCFDHSTAQIAGLFCYCSAPLQVYATSQWASALLLRLQVCITTV